MRSYVETTESMLKGNFKGIIIEDQVCKTKSNIHDGKKTSGITLWS